MSDDELDDATGDDIRSMLGSGAELAPDALRAKVAGIAASGRRADAGAARGSAYNLRRWLAVAAAVAVIAGGVTFLRHRGDAHQRISAVTDPSASPTMTASDTPSPTTAASTTASAPTTEVATPASASTDPTASASPTTVADGGTSIACPAAFGFANVVTGADAAAYDIARIHTDLQAIAAYESAHPADVVGEDITADKPARIKVWVTGDVAAQQDALDALVEHPQRVVVVASEHTKAALQAISDAVVADAQANPDVFTDFGSSPNGQIVDFSLAAGQEPLAQQYIDRWGDAVRITVGHSPYVPKGCGPQPVARTCADLSGSDPEKAGLALSVEARTPTITQSGHGSATLTVTDTGTSRFTIDIGQPILGTLVYPGTNRVAAFNGDSKGTGLVVDLAPGASQTIDVGFAADRCDGEAGSAVPPGTYGLRVAFTQEGPGSPPAAVYLSSEVPITVTANPNATASPTTTATSPTTATPSATGATATTVAPTPTANQIRVETADGCPISLAGHTDEATTAATWIFNPQYCSVSVAWV